MRSGRRKFNCELKLRAERRTDAYWTQASGGTCPLVAINSCHQLEDFIIVTWPVIRGARRFGFLFSAKAALTSGVVSSILEPRLPGVHSHVV